MTINESHSDTRVIRPPVSFGNEQLILVDTEDQIIGYDTKVAAHGGDGILHRAFSAFLFDDQQRLLVHRRSEKKPLWPAYWTNSCCSHPRRDEALDQAVHRRLREELGVEARISHIYQFEYHARFADLGSEHELCHVYLAHCHGAASISAHADEVMEWCWLSVADVDAWMRERPDQLTPWFKMEWQALRDAESGHGARLDAWLAEIGDNRSVA